jgi:cobalt-zinc-cadmium efflux system outer membrane protein
MPSNLAARALLVARAGVAVIALAAGAAHSEPANSPDPALDAVREAVREAWSRHPAAEVTEQTLAAAEARALSAARPLYNPDLEFSYDDEGPERTTTGGLGLTLDLSGKRRARTEAGQAELAVAQAEAALRRSGFAHQWLQAWIDRGIAVQQSEIGEQRVALVERFADLAERQFKVGDLSSLERDLALLARDEAQAEQATLLADVASAEEAFRAVGGASGRKMPLPAGDPPPAAWLGGSKWNPGSTSEGRLAAAASASAASRIAIAERERRPDPSVSVYGGRKDLGGSAGSEDVVGVSVSVPLSVRNRYQAELSTARAESAAAAADQRRVELELDARATRAVSTYDAVLGAWSRWSRSPGTDVTARADLLERLWRAGEISTSDYLIQLKQSLDTALAGAGLRGRLWRSYFSALYATGWLDAWVGLAPAPSEVNP